MSKTDSRRRRAAAMRFISTVGICSVLSPIRKSTCMSSCLTGMISWKILLMGSGPNRLIRSIRRSRVISRKTGRIWSRIMGRVSRRGGKIPCIWEVCRLTRFLGRLIAHRNHHTSSTRASACKKTPNAPLTAWTVKWRKICDPIKPVRLISRCPRRQMSAGSLVALKR